MPDDRQGVHQRRGAFAGLGFFAIGVFLCFAASTAFLASITLLWPSTPLVRIWRLNPVAYAQLAPIGDIAGPLFLLLGAALAAAAFGWFRHRLWGWRLAAAIFLIQVCGDFIHALKGDWLGGAIGVAIAGALLLFLFRPAIRSRFD